MALVFPGHPLPGLWEAKVQIRLISSGHGLTRKPALVHIIFSEGTAERRVWVTSDTVTVATVTLFLCSLCLYRNIVYQQLFSGGQRGGQWDGKRPLLIQSCGIICLASEVAATAARRSLIHPNEFSFNCFILNAH